MSEDSEAGQSAASVTENDVLAEARRRYFLDPVFRARVQGAVTTTRLDCQENGGGRLSGDEADAAATAAACALVLAEYALVDGLWQPHQSAPYVLERLSLENVPERPTHDGPCVRALDGDGEPLRYCATCFQDMP